jgi:hypothetical protein
MVPSRREKLKQTSGAHFKPASEDGILTAFIKWASCQAQAIITVIVEVTTPEWNVAALPIEHLFRKTLQEFSIDIGHEFQPILPDNLGQLEQVDPRIVIVRRASDDKECLAPLALVNANAESFAKHGYFLRRKTVWKDVP